MQDSARVQRRTATPDAAGRSCRQRHPSLGDTTASETDQGPFRRGSVGPYNPTTGVPTAPATWSGPVSPATITDAALHSAARSAMRVGGAAAAAPSEAATTRSASARSPGPQATTDGRPWSRHRRRASAPNRSAGQHSLRLGPQDPVANHSVGNQGLGSGIVECLVLAERGINEMQDLGW